MTPPPQLWHVEWVENFRARGGKTEDRRYKKPVYAARQVAAILAAPNEVAELRGLWVSDGWDRDRIDWTELDPLDFVRSFSAEVDDEEDRLSPIEHYERIRNSWKEAEER